MRGGLNVARWKVDATRAVDTEEEAEHDVKIKRHQCNHENVQSPTRAWQKGEKKKIREDGEGMNKTKGKQTKHPQSRPQRRGRSRVTST